MSKFEEQLKQIREERRLAYIKYAEQTEKMDMILNKEKENIEYDNRKNIVMLNLANKYKHVFNPSAEEKAATKIQRFIKNNWFGQKCINDDEIGQIPPLYRMRIYITNQHINEYSEEGIDRSMISTYRRIYNMNLGYPSRFILFRYCFDIRDLYFKRNQLIELYDSFYFMQPGDHARIESCWRKVNGETTESTIYLSNFDYAKSLAVDRNKNNITMEQKNQQKYNDIVSDIDFIIDNEFLDDINKKFLENN